MSQFKLTVACADFDAARTVAGYLEEAHVPAPLAVSLFEAGPPRQVVEAYFETPPDLVAVSAALTGIGNPGIGVPEMVAVPDQNWVALSQAALPPVSAGRFTVHGSHDRARVPFGPGAIEIDAGEAFGTAHHATTLGCLIAIDQLSRTLHPRRVLDLGCGSGVLAIAAARVWPRATILASDIDPIAVAVAAANARRNRAGGRIRFVTAFGLDAPALRGRGQFDLIVANILARPLIALAPTLAAALAPGGRLVLSGLLATQAHEVGNACRAAGLTLVERRDHTGWSVLVLGW